jgi:hypothetical protein
VDPYTPKREDEEHCFSGDAKTEIFRTGLGKLDHGKNENEIEKALGKARLCLIRTFFPKPMPFVFSHVTPHNGRAEDI